MSAGRTLEGAGCVTWWGFGPARDLLETCVPRPQLEMNVLLVGSSDPRHILKTISCLKSNESIHLWVMENSMEVAARQLLLLYVSLCAPEGMGMQEKTEVFLELFGNSEIRSQTDSKLKHIAARLSLSITESLDTDTSLHPCLDTTLLKFKERDELARIFRQWQNPPSTPLSMSKMWDARVRQHLGQRYDARTGCFDWDLSMKLHDRGCGVIHKHQYCRWRESGVAFEMREGLYCAANQSLLSTRVFIHRGGRTGVRGYWGDIVSSPYLSFGIETENKELLKTQNHQHVKTAQDISVANVQALFRSLCTRGGHARAPELTEEPGDDAAETGTGTLSGEDTQQPGETQGSDVQVKEAIGPEKETRAEEKRKHTNDQHDLMDLNGVRISFLSLDSLPKISMKSRYLRLFNALYFSTSVLTLIRVYSMVHHLNSSLTQTAAQDAALIVEKAKYLLDLSKEQEAAFTKRVGEMAKEAGFVPVHPQEDDAYAVFSLQKHDS